MDYLLLFRALGGDVGVEEMNILFGFDVPVFQVEVENYLKNMGYKVNSCVRTTKAAIRKEIESGSCHCAVLREVLNNNGNIEKYSADELAILTDERDINIVVVLNDNLRGTPYMRILYGANITSAVYQSGRTGGATAKGIGELLIKKRSREEARDVYGIDGRLAPAYSLSSNIFLECMQRLRYDNSDENLIERFIQCCKSLTYKQTAEFIQKIPAEIRDELILYEEFHTIVGILKSCGMDLKIRKPKKMMIGLSHPSFVKSIEAEEMPGSEPVKEEEVFRDDIIRKDGDIKDFNIQNLEVDREATLLQEENILQRLFDINLTDSCGTDEEIAGLIKEPDERDLGEIPQNVIRPEVDMDGEQGLNVDLFQMFATADTVNAEKNISEPEAVPKQVENEELLEMFAVDDYTNTEKKLAESGTVLEQDGSQVLLRMFSFSEVNDSDDSAIEDEKCVTNIKNVSDELGQLYDKHMPKDVSQNDEQILERNRKKKQQKHTASFRREKRHTPKTERIAAFFTKVLPKIVCIVICIGCLLLIYKLNFGI